MWDPSFLTRDTAAASHVASLLDSQGSPRQPFPHQFSVCSPLAKWGSSQSPAHMHRSIFPTVTSLLLSSSCYCPSLLFIAPSRHPTCLWCLLRLFLLLGFLLFPQKVPRSSVFNFVFSLSHCLPPPLDGEFRRSRTLPYFFHDACWHNIVLDSETVLVWWTDLAWWRDLAANEHEVI